MSFHLDQPVQVRPCVKVNGELVGGRIGRVVQLHRDEDNVQWVAVVDRRNRRLMLLPARHVTPIKGGAR